MSTPDTINLTSSIKEHLSDIVVQFIKHAGSVAEQHQQRLYLVGGIVRDLLLEGVNLDIDLVVEGDAIKLAQLIAEPLKAKVTVHQRFGTSNIKWGSHSADFITARAETYAHPGALPTVKPGTIKDDLARRDFTINAMAVEVTPRHFGELLDPFNGREDIKQKLVRVLHEKSFVDDATRIWRAIRYEQRLDFRIEPATLLLIKRDIVNLKTISGDRIRHELELVLHEEMPEKALQRADELGTLAQLHPALKGDAWLAEMFEKAREYCQSDLPNPDFYLALLCYRLNLDDLESLVEYLHLTKETTVIFRDTLTLKNKTIELESPGLAPSEIYDLLYGYHTIAYAVNIIAAAAVAAENIELYLNVLRHVTPALSGADLKRLGIKQGPKIKEVLQKLREARLDGKINSKKEEEAWVRGMTNLSS